MEPPSETSSAAERGYGALAADLLAPKRRPPSTGRWVVDRFSLLHCLWVPWLMFVVPCVLLSFRVHHAGLWVALLFLVVLRLAYVAWDSWRYRSQKHGYAAWLVAVFFLLACLAWYVAGIMVGKQNSALIAPYDAIINMGIYFDIDPDSPDVGYQLVDAGRIFFQPGTRLDISKSEGFKSGDVYCVAPVTAGHLPPGATYDIWAVGVNCCSGTSPDYHCGQYNNPRAYAGIRLLDDGRRPFYRLAVQQAEAAHHIRAPHPIFVEWVQDPMADTHASKEVMHRRLSFAVWLCLAVQFFVTATLAALLSKFHLFM